MHTYPVAKINLAAAQSNLARVKQLAPESQIIAVIKANAYGHGAIELAQALSASDAFAVARLSEALALREAANHHPIVVLEGVHSAEDLELATQHNLSLVFHHQSQLELLQASQLSKPLAFSWLMLETGMHRLGLTTAHAQQALTLFTPGSVGVMSHFANADERDDSRNTQQLEKTHNFALANNLTSSMANSAAILSISASHADWVRPGLMLYGISPFSETTAKDLKLKPVMTLSSKLIAVQQLQAGDQVGYGGDWIAQESLRIGIVSIGYGDGYSRHLSNIGTVLINGLLATVVGRVSMDMIAIDLSNNVDSAIGDEVILWGDPRLPVEHIAEQAGTIAYELVCQLTDRVVREYHYGES